MNRLMLPAAIFVAALVGSSIGSAVLVGCGASNQHAAEPGAVVKTQPSSDAPRSDARGMNAPSQAQAQKATARPTLGRHIIMEGEAPDDGPGYFLLVSDKDVDECKLADGILFGLAADKVEAHSQAIIIGRTDDVGEAFVCQGNASCVNGEGTVEVDDFVRGVGARGRYNLKTPNGVVSGSFDATWRECQ